MDTTQAYEQAAEATDEAKEAAQAPEVQPVTLEEFIDAYHHADIRRGDLHCRKIRGFHATERAEAVIKFEVVFIVRGDELQAEWMRVIYAADGTTKAEYERKGA